jgi:RES domain-containing protein
MFAWRISNHADLGGQGGIIAAGRWHNAGRPIVYCALHPATALVERLVHEEVGLTGLPDTYKYLKIEIPDGLDFAELPPLPAGWEGDEAFTRSIGDQWLARGDTALLYVPTVLVPETENLLINPRHAAARACRIVAEIPFPLDRRLLKGT